MITSDQISKIYSKWKKKELHKLQEMADEIGELIYTGFVENELSNQEKKYLKKKNSSFNIPQVSPIMVLLDSPIYGRYPRLIEVEVSDIFKKYKIPDRLVRILLETGIQDKQLNEEINRRLISFSHSLDKYSNGKNKFRAILILTKLTMGDLIDEI